MSGALLLSMWDCTQSLSMSLAEQNCAGLAPQSGQTACAGNYPTIV